MDMGPQDVGLVDVGVCATWAYSRAGSSITLTMLAPIPSGTPTTLTFGAAGKLTLPSDGVVENQATLNPEP